MKPAFDVLGLGCTAVDDLAFVDAYPAADAKVRLLRRERRPGGLTAIALIAAARLGARCAYAGALGRDPDSIFILEAFGREGIETRHHACRARARPVRSFVVVDPRQGTRTIFYDTSGVVGADPRLPGARLIQSARVLFVDRFGMPGMIRAARLARAAGIPVVGDFESADTPRLAELLSLVNHLIVSLSFARQHTGRSHPARATARLAGPGREVVVVTHGDQGCWHWSAADPKVRHLPAFRVRAVDTTGCGDVFHGAYAAALAEGLPLGERLRLAAAAAALKAMRPGGQNAIPTRAQVERFLRKNNV